MLISSTVFWRVPGLRKYDKKVSKLEGFIIDRRSKVYVIVFKMSSGRGGSLSKFQLIEMTVKDRLSFVSKRKKAISTTLRKERQVRLQIKNSGVIWARAEVLSRYRCWFLDSSLIRLGTAYKVFYWQSNITTVWEQDSQIP